MKMGFAVGYCMTAGTVIPKRKPQAYSMCQIGLMELENLMND
jgi:hypothetical protein